MPVWRGPPTEQRKLHVQQQANKMMRRFLSFIGLRMDSIAIGLIGGWYIKGNHEGVISYALEKLARCDTRTCDEFSVKYIIGYAILSARQLQSREKEKEVMEYAIKFGLNDRECIEMVVT